MDLQIPGTSRAPTQHAPGKGGSKRPDREPIYDMDAMHEKLEDIGWADNVPWEETLAITHVDRVDRSEVGYMM